MNAPNGKFVDLRTKTFHEMVGTILADRYELHNLLGSGGMGAVFRGTQKAVGRSVAIKVLPRIDPLTAARFQREARTVSKLSHPNTITVYDFGQSEEGYLFLVMEYLEGRTLRDLLKESGPLPPRRAVHLVHQICRSLSEAHSVGIVHRDMKPDNVILIHRDDDPDFVKVLDFGIAKAMYGDDPDDDITQQGRIVGTPRYMSPEQVLGLPVDHRADIYSVGIIFYQLLTGSPPFDDASTAMLMMKHAHELPPSFAEKMPSELVGLIPPGLEAIVMKAISKRPEARQQTVDMLRTELELVMPALGADMSRGSMRFQALARDERYPTPNPSSPSLVPPHSSTPDPSASHPALRRPPFPAGQAPWSVPHTPSPNATGPQVSVPRSPTPHPDLSASQVGRLPARVVAYSDAPLDDPPTQRGSKLWLWAAGGGALLFLGLLGAAVALYAWKTLSGAPQEAPRPSAQASVPPSDAEPTPRTSARITIESQPPGAAISAAGQRVGATPMVVEVPLDKERVTYELTLDGYEPSARTFALAEVPKDGERWESVLTPTKAEVVERQPDAVEDAPPPSAGGEVAPEGKAKPRHGGNAHRDPKGPAPKDGDGGKVVGETKPPADTAPPVDTKPPADAKPPADVKQGTTPAEDKKPKIKLLDGGSNDKAAPAGEGDKKPKVKLLE